MQASLRVAREPEWLKQALFFTCNFIGNEFSNTNHFIPVIGVSNNVTVIAKNIEDRKAVGCECTYSTGRLFFVFRVRALKPFLAVRQSRHPHLRERFINDIVRRMGAIRVYIYFVGIRTDFFWARSLPVYRRN